MQEYNNNNDDDDEDPWDLTIRIFANELGVDENEPFYEELVSVCNELLFTLPDERWKVYYYYYYFIIIIIIIILLFIFCYLLL
jgi:hypothetical protein